MAIAFFNSDATAHELGPDGRRMMIWPGTRECGRVGK